MTPVVTCVVVFTESGSTKHFMLGGGYWAVFLAMLVDTTNPLAHGYCLEIFCLKFKSEQK